MNKSIFFKYLSGVALAFTLMGSIASAATVTSLFGDKDSFGTGKGLDENVTITEIRNGTHTASDGPTDLFTKGKFIWTHEFDLAGAEILGATLTISSLHIEDYYGTANPTGPYDTLLFIDGVEYLQAFDDVGTIPAGKVDTLLPRNITTFNLTGAMLAMLADGKLQVTVNSAGTDQPDYFALDYGELTITTADEVAAVPLPAALPLLLAGLAAIGLLFRRKAY